MKPQGFVGELLAERVTLSGKCDGSPNVIAKCNGSSVTIKRITNQGNCEIEIYCLDDAGKEIGKTRHPIQLKGMLPIYIAPDKTDTVNVVCKKTDNEPECKYSMDV